VCCDIDDAACLDCAMISPRPSCVGAPHRCAS
jgi:hypothetical protein